MSKKVIHEYGKEGKPWLKEYCLMVLKSPGTRAECCKDDWVFRVTT